MDSQNTGLFVNGLFHLAWYFQGSSIWYHVSYFPSFLSLNPGVGNCTPLQYTCLEIFMDRGAWQATIHGAAKSRRQHAQRVAGIWGVAVTLPTLGGRYPWTSKSFSLKLVGELWTALMSVLRSLLLLLLLLLSHFSPVWPHRQQSMRLPHPWDSPGKNTGVGCHFLLHLRSLCSHY